MRFDFKAIKGEVKGQVKGEVKGEVNVSTETSEMTLYDNDDPEVGTRRSNKKGENGVYNTENRSIYNNTKLIVCVIYR